MDYAFYVDPKKNEVDRCKRCRQENRTGEIAKKFLSKKPNRVIEVIDNRNLKYARHLPKGCRYKFDSITWAGTLYALPENTAVVLGSDNELKKLFFFTGASKVLKFNIEKIGFELCYKFMELAIIYSSKEKLRLKPWNAKNFLREYLQIKLS